MARNKKKNAFELKNIIMRDVISIKWTKTLK